MSTSEITPYERPADGLDEWEAEPIRPRARLPLATKLLAAAALAAAAFAGGVFAHKEWGTGTTAAAANGGRAFGRGGFGGGGFGGGGFGAGASGATGAQGAAGSFLGQGATTGQVAYVKGSTLYVTDSTGNVVKVTVPAGLPVTKALQTTLAAVKPGDTVVVRGQAAADGTVVATSVTDGVAAAALGGGPGAGAGASGG